MVMFAFVRNVDTKVVHLVEWTGIAWEPVEKQEAEMREKKHGKGHKGKK